VKKRLLILVTVIMLIAIILFIFRIFGVQKVALKNIYPLSYSEYVEKYAKEYDIDPFLIYAIIKAESNFKKDVESKSGAVGLMQVMNDTAEDIAKELGIEYNDKEQLHEPDINIQIGVAYFSILLKRYDDNVSLALAAYNAGLGNVDSWIRDGIIKADGSDLENVPFSETNSYVRKILRDYDIYKEIYEQ